LYGRARGVYKPRYAPPDHKVHNTPCHPCGPIVCFGDSLTEGYGVPRNKSYPHYLAKQLGLEPDQVLNLGRSGDTSADGLKRLPQILNMSPLPQMVILSFGGNDLIQRRPLTELTANLQSMIAALHTAGCAVVLLGLRGSWLYKIDYETIFYQLAASNHCALVPLCLDGIWGVPWRMTDVAHPNARGYRMMATRIARVVAPLLETPKANS